MTATARLETLIAEAQEAFMDSGLPFGEINAFAAEYLSERGVTVLPCRVGDKLYEVCAGIESDVRACVDELTVTEVGTAHVFCSERVTPSDDINYAIPIERIGKTVFFSYAEAEAYAEKGGARVGTA